MGKEKKFRKVMSRLIDAAAGVIYWHDEMQLRFDRKLPVIWGILSAALPPL